MNILDNILDLRNTEFQRFLILICFYIISLIIPNTLPFLLIYFVSNCFISSLLSFCRYFFLSHPVSFVFLFLPPPSPCVYFRTSHLCYFIEATHTHTHTKHTHTETCAHRHMHTHRNTNYNRHRKVQANNLSHFFPQFLYCQ